MKEGCLAFLWLDFNQWLERYFLLQKSHFEYLCIHLVWLFGNKITTCFSHSPRFFSVRILTEVYLWERVWSQQDLCDKHSSAGEHTFEKSKVLWIHNLLFVFTFPSLPLWEGIFLCLLENFFLSFQHYWGSTVLMLKHLQSCSVMVKCISL